MTAGSIADRQRPHGEPNLGDIVSSGSSHRDTTRRDNSRSDTAIQRGGGQRTLPRRFATLAVRCQFSRPTLFLQHRGARVILGPRRAHQGTSRRSGTGAGQPCDMAVPKLSEDGSVVLMSGAAGARPPAAAPAYAACNAAIEGLGRGLAVELAPVRVNVVSPGTIDGNLWAHRAEEDREAAFAQYRRDTILRRPGTEDEIAQSVLFLFTNGFTTGATLYPDGGYTLR
ncbi:SDR family oxidoreductase [Streptomyces decoyicus]|uniref:SDR family oxidoreductase n=1 Tax=Streptomyces decoyicus TaxID=249567 RepID=UPI00363033A1